MQSCADGPGRATLGLAVGLQAVMSSGDGAAMIVLAARILQVSGVSWAVAVVFLAITIPITALAPAAGLLLDRLPVKPVLVTAAAVTAVIALVLSQLTSVAATIMLATGFGVCAAVLQPGLGAIVPRLAGRVGVTRANSYLQAATWAGFTAGPLLAGLLIAAGGFAQALIADAALYALGTAGLAMLRLAPPAGTGLVHPRPVPRAGGAAPAGGIAPGGEMPPAGGIAPAGGAVPLGAQLRAGFSYLRGDPDAGILVLTVGLIVAFTNLAVVAEVVFAERVLGSGPSGYSVLVAGWTTGMVIGTLLGGRLPRRRLVAAALAGTAVAGTGIALAGTAAALWQAAMAYGLGGLGDGLEIVATRSFLNHRVPGPVAGRVFALYSGLLFGAASLGMAAAAGLLGVLGARGVLWLAGGGALATGIAGAGVMLRRARAATPAGPATE